MDKDKDYWQKRCEAAEAVLVKYYNLLPNCPEFMKWQDAISTTEPHFINRENKIEPVIPESMREWMDQKNTVT